MYLKDCTPANLDQAIELLQPKEGSIWLLLCGGDDHLVYEQMIQHLNSRKISFLGGIFPGLIYGDQQYSKGVIIQQHQALYPPILIKNLHQKNFEIPDIELPIPKGESRTCLTLVDGLTAYTSTFLAALYEKMGKSMHFIGAGCGSPSITQKPCVITKEGILQDVAIICPIDNQVSLGVSHGWRKIAGPMVATRTEKNKIYELNWENAFKVYKSFVDQDADTPLEKEHFFKIAKGYPLGISKEGSEDIVRDPVAVDKDGALICLGEVPENTVLYLLKGEKESLLNSAAQAVSTARAKLEQVDQMLVIDCVSRISYLDDQFVKELEFLQHKSGFSGSQKIHGVLSLGEISTFGRGYLEFFNKTIVAGAIH